MSAPQWCPECAQGKHPNCTDQLLDENDEWAPCLCALAFHHPEIDHAGNLCCGQDFMAGTICSLPPGHDGPHEASCQSCLGDWMLGTCMCRVANRGESEPCEAGTVGCCINHTVWPDEGCHTW